MRIELAARNSFTNSFAKSLAKSFAKLCKFAHLQDDPSVNQEVLELFNILTDENFKNLFSIFEDVCKVKRDLNGFINTGSYHFGAALC